MLPLVGIWLTDLQKTGGGGMEPLPAPLQRVVMMGLAFEGEGPHKAADYFARLPLYPTTVQEFDQIHFTNHIKAWFFGESHRNLAQSSSKNK